MKKELSRKTLIILLIIPALILFDILFCVGLYFFEPVYFNSPDLSLSDYSFDLYKKYSDSSSSFYIKQISHEDIVSAETDSRLKYVDNTILLTYNDFATLDNIKDVLSPYNAEICGYIEDVNFVQAEFPGCDYPALLNICSELDSSNYIHSAIVDYFEETPLSETTETTDLYDDYNTYYYDLINYPADISDEIDTSTVTVGVFDVLVDSNNPHLSIKNKDTYDINSLNNPLIEPFNNHGTHVAGILGASSASNAPAICPDVQIISDNAMNNSISYWIAAITDMIVNHDVKVINMSIGYNSYITLSATLGCVNTLDYIESESRFFSDILTKLIRDGYEFVICTAAGNDSHSSINRIYNGYFSYGEKKLLDKFDIFDLFTENVEYCNSRYGLPITSIDNDEIRNRIIVVGSCDKNYNLTYYASVSDRTDIVAPGEMIYSLGTNNEYAYMSGTSMACPFISGTAALLFAKNNEMKGDIAKHIIVSSAKETACNSDFEFPLLDVTNALKMIK